MTKKCPKCRRILDEKDFHWKKKNIRRAVHCKDCSRKYIREHYWKNRDYYLDKIHKRNAQLKERAFAYIGSYLSSHSCVDCGEKDILVLEFDHKDRANKIDEIGKMISRKMSFERIKKEIGKCDIRCSNCHRRKTAKESGSWKLKYAPVA